LLRVRNKKDPEEKWKVQREKTSGSLEPFPLGVAKYLKIFASGGTVREQKVVRVGNCA